ncbi:MAG TPA: antitoxin VbhA family protein [Solirubrobacteraceae bacterium]|jgi:hypothetical protein|nr:antitoxin VbhA family protein [Solirubrobacteraceae bacterium]
MTDRYQEFLSVLGSVRLAGADPSPEVIALGMRWASGELATAELDAAIDQMATAAKQAVAGEPERSRPNGV